MSARKRRHPRKGWAEAAARAPAAGDGILLLGGFPNRFDHEEWEWPSLPPSRETRETGAPTGGGKRHPRAGWERSFAAAGPDPEILLGHFANRFDEEEWT